MREFKENKGSRIEPSEELMEKHKNFQKLKADYEQVTKRPKKPLYKDPKMFILLVIILIICFLLFNE